MKLLITTQVVDDQDPVLGFFHGWIREFSKHADLITVICLKGGRHSLPENVRVISLGKEKGTPRFSKLVYAMRLYRIAWKYRRDYDAVFVHMNPEYVALGAPLWKLLGKKIGLWYTHKSVDGKLRLASFLTDVVFTASKESFRLRSAKVRITGHGIDTDYFSPIEPTEGQIEPVFSIITAGRMSPIKQYGPLIGAAAALSLRLTIAGGLTTEADRAYEASLRASVKVRNLQSLITFAGPLPQSRLKPLLAEAGLFVNLSDTGSLDKAVLEAMAMEIPALTSNVAFRDILDQYGLFVSDIKNLGEKIAAIADMPARERQALGRKLRDYVLQNHSLPDLIKKIVELYEKN